ncbi:SusD/RagB family nutrient-binding outer membrane lipoprotein [Flavobacterium sp. K5-23]|uniref:SusD/RagB family nutrient-binding outer membrane lipoprotein n=1 Tax=Flavobacterium sp. K5-23 TaxID=2746225 RepID=UPI00200FF7F9|nr:SusD/RagB family nutrient-binding outer membrane lipoprotein [Flavobacterium sp. K5-23]UQD56060.1 SusD/RagB family nutrient-binding outer membrane lipoprotein [Flavobacterium sp. K5-23]
MKNIFIKKASLCLLIASVFSCTSFVEDMNVDPDNLTDSDATNLFQGVLLANQFFQTSSTTRNAMLWLNQANGENRQYVSLNNWNNTTASEFDDSWNNAYVNCITQAKITQEKAGKELNPRLKGAAQVIEAHCMGTVTSLWGDAPYSEIDITGKNLTPKYDTQASIYAKMQTLLDQAITNLQATTGKGIPSGKDIYYEGDAAKWIKLAYSLKAKFYLHVKNYPSAKANAVLGISNPSGDFKAKFGNSYGQSFNPFYSFLVYDRDDYMSGDGYAARILDPSNALYRGNAKTDESARFLYTYLPGWYYFPIYEMNINSQFDWGEPDGRFGTSTSMPLVTYGEMLLIISEADARTSFVTGLTSYNNYRALLNTGYSIGIDNAGYYGESFRYLPYDALDFAIAGMENVSGSLSNQNALLREIYQERYIYFIGSFEGFTDFGRTNNLAGIQLKAGNAGTPQRFLYPQVEINANPNTPKPIPTIVTKTPVNN